MQRVVTGNGNTLDTITSRLASEMKSIAAGPQLHVDGLGVLDSTDRVFLGTKLVTAIWEDNDLMSLPSWIGRLPPRIGSTQHGKLSADQLRTACCINFVTTLIHTWGHAPQGSKWKGLLDNFMNLVAAVKLAHMHTLTPQCIKKYHTFMHTYLTGMLELYPHHGILPVHHLSLHLTQLLERYGPVHAWRCFPFERYNGVMQTIPTNTKFGKSNFSILWWRDSSTNPQYVPSSSQVISRGLFLTNFAALKIYELRWAPGR